MRGLRAKGLGAATALAALLAVGAWQGRAAASTYQVIYDASEAGANVEGVLAADTAGNLYATNITLPGSLFVLMAPKAGGTAWTKRTLATFSDNSPIGYLPDGGVVLVGNVLVGSNQDGGINGQGTVYEYSATPQPTTVALHAFDGAGITPPDGAQPFSGLTPGLGGLLYGTTYEGGTSNYGTVYSISPSTTAPRYTVLHRFTANGDGANPAGGSLAVDARGNLYGATAEGGVNPSGSGLSSGDGTVYAMQYVNGGWKEQVLYAFKGLVNGATDFQLGPAYNVALDPQGNVYGCAAGGVPGEGGIYMLTPSAKPGSAWTETILLNFGDVPGGVTGDGGCEIAFDKATGQIVGTTFLGGSSNKGTIFELNPPAAGQSGWTLAVIHNFTGVKPDGKFPYAPPLEVNGVFYGGTQTGSFYEFTP